MFMKEYEDCFSVDENMYEKYKMYEIAYFDIETTGFDKDQDKIILASVGSCKDKKTFNIKQYYLDNFNDEKQLLQEFTSELNKYESICSYNGIAFDEPFIKRRMAKNNIVEVLPEDHVDLYRLVRPYYKKLGMERCNLKSVEKHIGIERKDKIDGGLSVSLYYDYLKNRDTSIMEVILLHNYEDVLNLPRIHEFIYRIKNDCNIVRDDSITEKQLKFLKSLLKRNKIEIKIEIESISKRAASRLIDQILKGQRDIEVMEKIISNSY